MILKSTRCALLALLLGQWAPGALAATEVAGVSLEDTATVGDQALKLNGAGWRKRGYFRVDVTAVYLPQKATSLDAIEKAPGAKRLQLVIQQDISGSQAARYFLSDFEAVAAPAEFAQLINEVSLVGDIYGSLPRIRKGDVVTLDWIPAKGLLATLNGNVLTPHGASSPYTNSELLARVMFRMYIGGKTPSELRDNLLGLSTSMRDHGAPPPAVEAPAASSRPR